MDILLVEGDALKALRLAGQLARAGHRAKAVTNDPASALALLREMRFGGALIGGGLYPATAVCDMAARIRSQGGAVVWDGAHPGLTAPGDWVLSGAPDVLEISSAFETPPAVAVA